MTDSLLERFNGLTVREKTIFFSTLLIVVWAAWDSYIYQPIITKQEQLTNELNAINIQLSAQQQAATQIKALGKTDPDQANKHKLAEVKLELQKLKQQLEY